MCCPYDRGARKGAIHRVSAWGSANGLVLGQLKMEEKSNEITAIFPRGEATEDLCTLRHFTYRAKVVFR
jgi:hypothetical protein